MLPALPPPISAAPGVARGLAALVPPLRVQAPLTVTTPLTLSMLAPIIAPITINLCGNAANPATAGQLGRQCSYPGPYPRP